MDETHSGGLPPQACHPPEASSTHPSRPPRLGKVMTSAFWDFDSSSPNEVQSTTGNMSNALDARPDSYFKSQDEMDNSMSIMPTKQAMVTVRMPSDKKSPASPRKHPETHLGYYMGSIAAPATYNIGYSKTPASQGPETKSALDFLMDDFGSTVDGQPRLPSGSLWPPSFSSAPEPGPGQPPPSDASDDVKYDGTLASHLKKKIEKRVRRTLESFTADPHRQCPSESSQNLIPWHQQYRRTPQNEADDLKMRIERTMINTMASSLRKAQRHGDHLDSSPSIKQEEMADIFCNSAYLQDDEVRNEYKPKGGTQSSVPSSESSLFQPIGQRIAGSELAPTTTDGTVHPSQLTLSADDLPGQRHYLTSAPAQQRDLFFMQRKAQHAQWLQQARDQGANKAHKQASAIQVSGHESMTNIETAPSSKKASRSSRDATGCSTSDESGSSTTADGRATGVSEFCVGENGRRMEPALRFRDRNACASKNRDIHGRVDTQRRDDTTPKAGGAGKTTESTTHRQPSANRAYDGVAALGRAISTEDDATFTAEDSYRDYNLSTTEYDHGLQPASRVHPALRAMYPNHMHELRIFYSSPASPLYTMGPLRDANSFFVIEALKERFNGWYRGALAYRRARHCPEYLRGRIPLPSGDSKTTSDIDPAVPKEGSRIEREKEASRTDPRGSAPANDAALAYNRPKAPPNPYQRPSYNSAVLKSSLRSYPQQLSSLPRSHNLFHADRPPRGLIDLDSLLPVNTAAFKWALIVAYPELKPEIWEYLSSMDPGDWGRKFRARNNDLLEDFENWYDQQHANRQQEWWYQQPANPKPERMYEDEMARRDRRRRQQSKAAEETRDQRREEEAAEKDSSKSNETAAPVPATPRKEEVHGQPSPPVPAEPSEEPIKGTSKNASELQRTEFLGAGDDSSQPALGYPATPDPRIGEKHKSDGSGVANGSDTANSSELNDWIGAYSQGVQMLVPRRVAAAARQVPADLEARGDGAKVGVSQHEIAHVDGTQGTQGTQEASGSDAGKAPVTADEMMQEYIREVQKRFPGIEARLWAKLDDEDCEDEDLEDEDCEDEDLEDEDLDDEGLEDEDLEDEDIEIKSDRAEDGDPQHRIAEADSVQVDSTQDAGSRVEFFRPRYPRAYGPPFVHRPLPPNRDAPRAQPRGSVALDSRGASNETKHGFFSGRDGVCDIFPYSEYRRGVTVPRAGGLWAAVAGGQKPYVQEMRRRTRCPDGCRCAECDAANLGQQDRQIAMLDSGRVGSAQVGGAQAAGVRVDGARVGGANQVDGSGDAVQSGAGAGKTSPSSVESYEFVYREGVDDF